MFDIGWSELALIAVVALIAIGPKELPSVLRTVGQWMGKARRMASEFQGQFQEAMREAEMADLKQSFDEVREAAKGLTGGGIMTSLQKDVTSALRIDDVDKPMDPQAAPAVEAPATSSDAPATSNIDAQATSSDAPTIPTTPEPPTAETSVEAEIHAATSEPLAITPEVQSRPIPQDTTPEPVASESAASEVQRDAKAS